MSKAFRRIAGSVTLLLGVVLTACSGAVATVNGQAISHAQFDAKLEGSPIAGQILQQMVQEALITQYAKENGLTVTDAQIAAREDQLKANFPNGTWDQMLSARGLTEKDVHDALRNELILDQALGKNITITNAQISDYFNRNHKAFDKAEQVCASHILVSSLATANQVESALNAHGNFAALAQQYSIDPGSKSKGGSLGCFHRGQMTPAFDKAAFSLPVGKVSRPVQSPFGYHIILVTAHQPAQRATLASAHDQVAQILRTQQEQPLLPPFMQSLQQKATIKVNDPRFASLFPPPVPAPVPASAAPVPAASPGH